MRQSWDERYAANENLYGLQPNAYFRQFVDHHKPGSLLLPAEGEGRNAVYAASRGWQVDAFDFSPVAAARARGLATRKGLQLQYELKEIGTFRAGKQYDAVALIYVHLPGTLRKQFHNEIYHSIRPGGFLLLEAFAKEQEQFTSGGPKDPALLYDAPSICQDFPFLHLLNCEQKEIHLDEGSFHKGAAAVLRMTGQRL